MKKQVHLLQFLKNYPIISISFAFILSLAQTAHAVYQPGWERPIKAAEMKVTQANFSFQNVRFAKVTLTRQDGNPTEDPTGITLEYGVSDAPAETDPRSVVETIDSLSENMETSPTQNKIVVRKLVITQQKMNRCGAITYIASLPGSETQENPSNQAGLTVYLTDHSNSICPPNEKQGWNATVRNGSGALDATMDLVGIPDPIMTIQ